MSQAGGGQRGYTYSPDGRWWWDGRQWQPAGPAASRGPGTGGRWLIAAVIVIIAATAVPLALTAAAAIALRAGHVSPPRGLPPPSAPYLADASETGIELAVTSQGLQCGTPPVHFGFGRTPTIRTCHRSIRGEVLTVDVIGSDDRVTVVHAGAVDLGPGDDSAALALFKAVVTAAVAGPDGAADAGWVTAHFGQPGTSRTTVGGVALQMTLNGSARSLIVQPATT